MGLLQEVYAEIARLESDIKSSMQSTSFQVDLQEVVQDIASDVVYDDYEPSAWAMSTRRRYAGGVMAKKNIIVTVDGMDLTIEAKAPLQHAYKWWKRVNASDVVIKGIKKYNQPYPRKFLIDSEMGKETELELYIFLSNKGYDIKL